MANLRRVHKKIETCCVFFQSSLHFSQFCQASGDWKLSWDAGTAQAWNVEFEPGQTRSAMIFAFADRFAVWATPAIISEAGRQASASLRRCSMLFLPTDVKQENIP